MSTPPHFAERFKERLGGRATAEVRNELRQMVLKKTAKLLSKREVYYPTQGVNVTRYTFWAFYEGAPINFVLDSLGHFVTVFRPGKEPRGKPHQQVSEPLDYIL